MAEIIPFPTPPTRPKPVSAEARRDIMEKALARGEKAMRNLATLARLFQPESVAELERAAAFCGRMSAYNDLEAHRQLGA
jgi:hypothetical protein